MVEVDYLRKVYSELPTEKLVEYLLVRSDDLVPEALSVMKEEFEKRGGEINDLLKKEMLKSGASEFISNTFMKSSLWTSPKL